MTRSEYEMLAKDRLNDRNLEAAFMLGYDTGYEQGFLDGMKQVSQTLQKVNELLSCEKGEKK